MSVYAHGRRLQMKPEWRMLGAPQTAAQKRFVRHYAAEVSAAAKR
jgi:hypothetical protein